MVLCENSTVQTTHCTQSQILPQLCWKMHFLFPNVDNVHLLLHEATFYKDLVYFSLHFVKNVIGKYTQNVAHQNSGKSNQWFRRRHTGGSWLTSFQYTQFKNYGILNKQKKKKLKRAEFFLAGMKEQRDQGSVRILLGDNTCGRAVRLWPIGFQCVGVWISAGPLSINTSIWPCLYSNPICAESSGKYCVSRGMSVHPRTETNLSQRVA